MSEVRTEGDTHVLGAAPRYVGLCWVGLGDTFSYLMQRAIGASVLTVDTPARTRAGSSPEAL